MECIFLNTAGTTLFVRDDMESGHWVQEQMNLTADFPFVAGKVIEFGQRVAFRDPVTDNLEVFEIINVVNQESDHFQQITAEHICITELSDEHINNTEITDKSALQALTTALTGTLWAVGNNTASGTQSADFSRGSVWDAVNTIQQNWNVYITPRVVISSAGVITGRYLDIAPAQGIWRGLRLSVRKNMYDPSVTYDDSEVYTALYGYGGSVEVAQTGQDDKTEELTFKDVVWTATAEHPAKPAGQTYLEWPEKTALYGRNGRPRFGYYQNGNIEDANLLLQKTWESLQKSCEPSVNITGTCTDLYRLGYKDQPIRLHDMAIVEIEETGELLYRQVICNDVDLIDATNTRPQIGDYIANIVYINRKTNEKASGRGGGGGGRGSMTNNEDDKIRTWTEFVKNDQLIGMVAGTRQGNNYIKAGQIILAMNETGTPGSYESAAYINAAHVNIGAGSSIHALVGSLEYDPTTDSLVFKDPAGGMVVERTEQGMTAQFGIYDEGTLTGGIVVDKINGQSGTITRVKGDMIVIGNDSSIDPTYRGKTLDGSLTEITTDFTSVNTLLAQKIEADDINATTVQAAIGQMSFLGVNGLSSYGGISAQAGVTCASLTVNQHTMRVANAAVSSDGKVLVISMVDGSSVNFTSGGSYNDGWNDCIDAATLVTRYTRNTGVYGGSTVHYYKDSQGDFVNIGANWYKTSQANAYTLPDPKT